MPKGTITQEQNNLQPIGTLIKQLFFQSKMTK